MALNDKKTAGSKKPLGTQQDKAEVWGKRVYPLC